MSNMRIYEAMRSTPNDAKKPIKGGRLKGMTDVNPMFRIKKLTEVYGPAGVGWYTDILDKRTQNGANGEVMCFMDLNLYVKDPLEQTWSKPIFGTGGSTLVQKESSGLFANDEGWKMAYTDALSVACKALGMCADVYWEADRTKYTTPPDNSVKPPQNAPETVPDKVSLLQIQAIGQMFTPERLDAMCQHYGISNPSELTFAQADAIIKKRQREIEKERGQ